MSNPPPSAEAWQAIVAACPSDQQAVADALPALSEWPDALRLAPPEWRRAGEPRLRLCRSLSGLYLHRKGRKYHFYRIYADGEIYTASVDSPHPAKRVLSDVSKWFGRELRSDPSEAHRYTFDGEVLRYSYRSRWNGHEFGVEGRFDDRGRLLVASENLTTGARFEHATDALGDGAAIAPARVDVNRASTEDLMALPSVTRRRAEAIVSHRAAHGSYRKPGDLLQVKGIGPGVLAMFEHLITL